MGKGGDYLVSRIDEQIKELQLKKKKIEFLTHILNSAKEYKDKDFDEVKDDVVSMLSDFIEKAIDSIENDKPMEQPSFLSEQDLEVVKTLVDRVKNRDLEPNLRKKRATKKEEPRERTSMDNNDKLNFALNHRHLANKKVTVANNENITVYGTVVGLDAPNVVVKTDNGPTINVPIDKIGVVE